MNAQTTRWTIVVDKALDRDLRRYLAENGGKKGDISIFVTRAVNKLLLREALKQSWSENADLSAAEIAALEDEIDNEVKTVRQRRLSGNAID